MTPEIRCLGRLQVRFDTSSAHEVGPTRAGQILAALALARDGVRTREQLVASLWPDLDETRARRRLRQGLWELRQQVGVGVRNEGTTLILGDSSRPWVDVHAFEDAARGDEVEQLEHSVELYRGELLEGWWQEWILDERRRLAELADEALLRLLRTEEANGRHRAALTHAHRRASVAPLDEGAHQDVMRLCAVLERWNEGLQQAEACRDVLWRELGLAPSQETEGLRRQLLEGRDREVSSPARTLGDEVAGEGAERSLVGRASERRALIRATEQALAGRGRLVFVEGPAGIGKTRLLDELAEDARWRGLSVLWGQGRQQARGEPYGVLGQALRTQLTAARLRRLRDRLSAASWWRLGPIMPASDGLGDEGPGNASRRDEAGAGSDVAAAAMVATGEAAHGRLRDAAAELLRALAQFQPMLVVVDDAQWADPATLHTFAALLRQAPPAPVTVVLAYRSGEARLRSPIWRAFKHVDAQVQWAPLRIELGPLGPEASLHVVQAEFGVADAAVPLASWLHERTGGHPLFLLEALQSLRRRGALGGPAESASLPRSRAEAQALAGSELDACDALEDLVREQRRRLSRAARRLLDVLSVVGAPCDAAWLEALADDSGEPAYAALEELLRWGFVREAPEGWRLPHDLLRQVVYRSVHAGRRRELHGRVADAWAQGGAGPPHVVAMHLARAGRWGEAADAYGRAARAAAALGGYEEALRHVREAKRAAERAEADAVDGFELLAMEEAYLHVLARRDEQARTLEAMVTQASDPRQGLEVRLRRARAWVRMGRPEAAMAEAEQARTLAEAEEHAPQMARALDTAGLVAYEAGRAQAALPLLERAAEAYDARGEAGAAAAARRRLGAALAEVQAFPRAERSLERARDAYRRVGDLHGQAEAEARLGVIQRQRGRGDEAERSYRGALERFREAGDRWSMAQTATNLGLLLNARGRIADALAWLDTAVREAGEIGERRGEAIARANAASIRQALLGEHGAARADAEAALDALATLGDHRLRPLASLVLANVEVDAGDASSGLRRLEEARVEADAAGHRWLAAQAHRDLARAHILQNDASAARRHVEDGGGLAETLGLATLTTELQALGGLAFLMEDRRQAAAQATEAAMRAPRTGVNRAYLIPYARHRVAVACGWGDEAASTIHEARDMLAAVLRGLPGPRVRSALRHVPEHRALVEAHRSWWPEHRDVELPVAHGSQARARDARTVTRWTVSEPEDMSIRNPRVRRRRRVARLVRQARAQGTVPTVAALAQALEVSRSTIKRDLAHLRRSGHALAARPTAEA